MVWHPAAGLGAVGRLARVALGVHYLSDIVAGSVLGLLAGLVMLAVSPLVDPNLPFDLLNIKQVPVNADTCFKFNGQRLLVGVTTTDSRTLRV